jgi:DNA mismatch repair protein MutS2
MDTRTLRLLEYDKIRQMLRTHASSSLGKEHIDRMRPVRDAGLVRVRMQETTEARSIITEHGGAPLGGLHDVRELVLRAQKQGTLAAQELLEVADTAACCRRMRHYLADSRLSHPRLFEQGKLLSEFVRVERSVNQAISAGGDVLDTASPELERARRRVRSLHQL